MACQRDKRNIFHRTIELQLNCGCETLRQFLHSKLNQMHTTLKKHLEKPTVRRNIEGLYPQYLSNEQYNRLFPDPCIHLFDITILSLLLLNGKIKMTSDEKDKIIRLRKLRNELSHGPRAELDDEKIFNESSHLIIGLALASGQDFERKMKQNIADLGQKELVTVKSNIDLVMLRNECYLVKLVESEGEALTGNESSDTNLLRFGLTKWTETLRQSIQLDVFMSELKQDDILTYTEKVNIEKHYNKMEQSSALIMKMVDETNENLLKFCRCLRKRYPLLADLVENKADGGEEIMKKLGVLQQDHINDALQKFFQIEAGGKVKAEDVHVLLEHKLGYSMHFSTVKSAVGEVFGIEHPEVSVCWFIGIKWKLDRQETLENIFPFVSQADTRRLPETAETTIGYINLTCEEFGERISKRIEDVKKDYGPLIKEALIEECISPKTFSKLDEEKLRFYLAQYMKGNRLVLGVMEELLEIQLEIVDELKRQKTKICVNDRMKSLRSFDTVPVETKYHLGDVVNPATGNLLVPVHEFRTFRTIDTSPTVYLVRECVKFICACLNTRKNGTIHFGIEPNENGLGKIVGIQTSGDDFSTNLDYYVQNGIETCFSRNQIQSIKRCIRPLQAVQIEEGGFVLEMDVVASTWYINDDFFKIKFPPKGNQTEHMFVYTMEPHPDIVSVPLNKLDVTEDLYFSSVEDRKLLETKIEKRRSDNKIFAKLLRDRLTAGSNYLTDEYFPIIVFGKITGVDNEQELRTSIEANMTELFSSAFVVFDFDTSNTILRCTEEKSSVSYQIKTTENKIEFCDDASAYWIYCNGNDELAIPEMNPNEWSLERATVIKNILVDLKRMIPSRALLLFLFFESAIEGSPMSTIAEECMLYTFRNECIVIASSEESVAELKQKVNKLVTEGEDFEQHFHTHLQWDEIANVLKTVSRGTSFSDIQLPCSDGRIAYLNVKKHEKLNFVDIEIVSGKQCIEEEYMTAVQLRSKKLEVEKKFYRGEDISMWNFSFPNQVGNRDIYSKILKSVKDKLKKGANLIETETILHHPGAGGSTAGRFLIWRLSQFKYMTVEGTYRCCIVKQITDSTANQIYDFMSFEDRRPKSAVILIDDVSEESIGFLKEGLFEKAYKKHQAVQDVFCVIVIIRRVPVSYMKKGQEHLLEHQLSHCEQMWFEDKYMELERTQEIDVHTLISFNVMRKSFDQKYINELAKQFLDGVRDVEVSVLKCLALINHFDIDTCSVIPFSIFDYLMSDGYVKQGLLPLEKLIGKGPVGLIVPMLHHRQKLTRCYPWNTNVTKEFGLLTKQSHGRSLRAEAMNPEYNGIMMISQTLATAVLFNIMEKEDIGMQQLVGFVLQVVKNHVEERNPMSKEFVKIVNSLFKTRQFITEDGDTRAKFSDMVMYLNNQFDEDKSKTVIKLMKECFDITRDAMVGQQLARFYIYMQDYGNAEDTIKEAIDLQPKSSYLRDTYGQVFFSKMEHMLNIRGSQTGHMNDKQAAEVVEIAYKAIENFMTGQAITSEKEDGGNTSCYYMEVKTILLLLENFPKFSFYKDKKDLLNILNDADAEIPASYESFSRLCDLSRLKRDSATQIHAENSLRLLEERDYQLKRRLYSVTAKDETLLLKLRERFERFYGNEKVRDSFKFKYGVGLKSLMFSHDRDERMFKKRVDDAYIKLQQNEEVSNLKNVDKRDLLVFLGNEVIRMSSMTDKTDTTDQSMTKEKYNICLRYSDKLLEIEEKSQRPYLEAFLYFTILNWPSQSRQDIENLGRPEKFKNLLKLWDKAFFQNHKSECRRKTPFPKTYFALGNGSLGCDIVDFRLIEKMWREKTGKKRQYVQDDQVWDKPYVQKILKRLEGNMNFSGTCIQFQTSHLHWNYEFNIRCIQPYPPLCNRRVTFILVFTWAGPKATDVRDIEVKKSLDEDGPSSLDGKEDTGSEEGKKHGGIQTSKTASHSGNNAASGKSQKKGSKKK